MYLNRYLTIELILNIFQITTGNYCNICDLKNNKIDSAFTVEAQTTTYLISGNTVWKLDYIQKYLESDIIQFNQLFIDGRNPGPIEKPDAVFLFGRTDSGHLTDEERNRTEQFIDLTVVFKDDKYYLFRRNLKDDKFDRERKNIPEGLVSNGYISDWINHRGHKVVEALYMSQDYRIYLFTEPSNPTHYPYYYNQNQFQNSKNDFRTLKKSSVTVQFDAAFYYGNTAAIFIRGDRCCQSSVMPENFLLDPMDCFNWEDFKEKFFSTSCHDCPINVPLTTSNPTIKTETTIKSTPKSTALSTKSTTSSTHSTKIPTTLSTKSTQKSTISSIKSTQKPTTSSTKSTQKCTTSSTKSTQKSTTSSTKSTQKSTTSSTKSTQKSTTSSTKSTQKSTTPSTQSTPKSSFTAKSETSDTIEVQTIPNSMTTTLSNTNTADKDIEISEPDDTFFTLMLVLLFAIIFIAVMVTFVLIIGFLSRKKTTTSQTPKQSISTESKVSLASLATINSETGSTSQSV